MRGALTAFVALSAWQMLSVTAQADDACMTQCGAQARADFTKYNCANADDAPCLCAATDFRFGVRDCSTSCGASEDEATTKLNDTFCVGQAQPADQQATEQAPEAPTTAPAEVPETTAAPEPAPTTEAVPTTEPEPTTEAQPTTEPQGEPLQETPAVTPVVAPVSETTSEPAAKETSAEAPESTSASEPTETAASETQSSSTMTTKTRTASDVSQTAGAGKEDDNDDDSEKKDDREEDGLSQATIIGIGVGAGAGGLAIIGILVWLCLRKRSKQPSRPFMEISKPMPAEGAGSYTGRLDPFAEKRGDVMEMTSNRYEDLLPRHAPRTVV